MHELSIAQSIVESACETLNETEYKSVTKISLEIGLMSGVVKECLEFVFPEATLLTPLENCQLEIKIIPLKIKCRECQKENEQNELMMVCPQCHSTQVELLEGREMRIKSMEVQ